MRLTMLAGIAKPMPWPLATMAVLIPMTSPRRFTSGPPELPGLIDASVWMKFSYVAIPTSARPVALTTPTVTVLSSPKGLPIAIAHSPTRSVSEFPSVATATGASGSNWITARSVVTSAPMMRPEYSRFDARRSSTPSAPRTTWLFVRT